MNSPFMRVGGQAMLCTECGMPKEGRFCGNPQCRHYVGAGWVTTSPSPANDHYLGNRLLYGPVDDRLAGIASAEMVGAFFRKAFIWGLVAASLGLLSWLSFSLLRMGRLGSLTFELCLLGSFVVFFLPFRIPISGWTFTLDDKAAAADSSYAQIYAALRRRESPVTVEPVRITGGFGRRPCNYLRIRHREFSAYVSSFPIGRDLFIGWTIWWEWTPLPMIWAFIQQQLGSSYFQLVLRSDEAQAFREIVHNATREGVDIASLGIKVPTPTTFGSEVTTEGTGGQ
jgi:hypothetical protein